MRANLGATRQPATPPGYDASVVTALPHPYAMTVTTKTVFRLTHILERGEKRKHCWLRIIDGQHPTIIKNVAITDKHNSHSYHCKKYILWVYQKVVKASHL